MIQHKECEPFYVAIYGAPSIPSKHTAQEAAIPVNLQILGDFEKRYKITKFT